MLPWRVEDVLEVVEPLPVGDGLDPTVAHAERTAPGGVAGWAGFWGRGAGVALLAAAAAATRLRPWRLAS